jgi:hypothetical protein
LHWKKHDVINKADLFLDERFGVADAGEQAVVARSSEGALADLFFGDEEACALRLSAVLGAIGEEGLETLLNEWGDVDDEGWPDVGVEAGVEDFEGAVRGCGWFGVCDRRGYNFGEAADEAGFVAEGCGGVVIGMAALPVGQDDYAGAETPENRGDFEAVGEGVFYVAVGKVEGFAVRDFEDAGGGVGLGFAIGCGASGAGFSLGEVEDGGAVAAGLHGEEGAAAGLFYVVPVGGHCKDIDGRGSRE